MVSVRTGKVGWGAAIQGKSAPICTCGGNSSILAVHRHTIHGELYFCIVSVFFIAGMQNMPKACSSHCLLYSIKTSHLILMVSQEDRVHSQFSKEPKKKKNQSERNSEKLLETTQHKCWQSQPCAEGNWEIKKETKYHKLLSCSEENNCF